MKLATPARLFEAAEDVDGAGTAPGAGQDLPNALRRHGLKFGHRGLSHRRCEARSLVEPLAHPWAVGRGRRRGSGIVEPHQPGMVVLFCVADVEFSKQDILFADNAGDAHDRVEPLHIPFVGDLEGAPQQPPGESLDLAKENCACHAAFEQLPGIRKPGQVVDAELERVAKATDRRAEPDIEFDETLVVVETIELGRAKRDRGIALAGFEQGPAVFGQSQGVVGVNLRGPLPGRQRRGRHPLAHRHVGEAVQGPAVELSPDRHGVEMLGRLHRPFHVGQRVGVGEFEAEVERDRRSQAIEASQRFMAGARLPRHRPERFRIVWFAQGSALAPG